MTGLIKSPRFLKRVKNRVKAFLRKAVPTKHPEPRPRFAIGSEESLPRLPALASTCSFGSSVASALGAQAQPATIFASETRLLLAGSHVQSHHGEDNIRPEPVDGASDWSTTNGPPSSSDTADTVSVHGRRILLRLGRSAGGDLRRAHFPQHSVSSAANAQIFSSPPQDQDGISSTISSAADSQSSSVPSFRVNGVSKSVDELVESTRNSVSEHQQALVIDSSFFDPSLPDPFVQQAIPSAGQPSNGLSTLRQDTGDEYLLHGFPSSAFDINELTDRPGCSSPNFSNTQLVHEVVPSSPAPELMQTRIPAEVAVANAELVMDSLSEDARAVITDLIDQSCCYYNNCEYYQQQNQRAEAREAMTWQLVTERDAEIANLRARLEHPEEWTPERPKRRQSFPL